MKNGELPAHPVECQYGSDKLEGLRTGEYSGFETGLTKREYFAGLAMQGLLANSALHSHERFDIKGCAISAVSLAEELLKQLEA
jgi:hypothetical protein